MFPSLTQIFKRFTAVFALMAMVVTAVQPIVTPALADDSNKGFVNVNVDPVFATYTITDSLGNVTGPFEGPRVHELDAGMYGFTFNDLDGYQNPFGESGQTVVQVAANSPQPLDAIYISNATDEDFVDTGSFKVNVTPESATYSVFNSLGESFDGNPYKGSREFNDKETGVYSIFFHDQDGCETPYPEERNRFRLELKAGDAVEVPGNYDCEVEQNGSINVTVIPENGSYTVTDSLGNTVRAGLYKGSRIFEDLAPGVYGFAFNEFNNELPFQETDGRTTVKVLPNRKVDLVADYEPLDEPIVVELDGFLDVVLNDERGSYTITDSFGNLVNIVGETQPFVGSRDDLELAPGLYLIQFQDIPGTDLITPFPNSNNRTRARIIGDQETTVVGNYVDPNAETAIIRVVVDNAQQAVIDNASITINGTTTDGLVAEATVDIAQDVNVSFGTVNGFNEPSAFTIDAEDLTAGTDPDNNPATNLFTRSYTPTGGGNDFATIRVTTNPTGGDVVVTNDGGTEIQPEGNTLDFRITIAGDYTLTYQDVIANFNPAPTDTVTVSAQDIQDGRIFNITGDYVPEGGGNETADIRVVIDNADQAVIDNASITINGVETTGLVATATFDIANALTVEFGAVDGFDAPPSITRTANFFAAGSNPTDNPDTNLFTVSYTPEAPQDVTLVKNVSLNADISVATYTLTLTRNDDRVDESISVNITDTIADGANNGVLSGSNGGTLSFVQNSGEQQKDSDAPLAIDPTAAMNVVLDTPDTVVTITYRMTFDNNGIPNNSSSDFTNVATYTFNGETFDAANTLTLNGPVVNTGGGGGGGGGSCCGGGVVVNGDMEIQVEKLVSLDGFDFREANTHQTAVVVPENQDSRLFVIVRLTNVGELTAKNIEYVHFFDSAKSDMTAEGISNLSGASLNGDGNILIPEITVGETVEFSYDVLIHENGQSDEPAFDTIELVGFKSRLSRVRDFLNYVGIGDQFSTYLFAGRIPPLPVVITPQAFGNLSDGVSIRVNTDRTTARIGEEVNVTLNITNETGSDLTNLNVSHLLPNELEVVNRGGAQQQQRELKWKRIIIRPNETAQFRLKAKVVGGALGSQVTSVTSATVNELEDILPVTSLLGIEGGAVRVANLVQTGPMTNALIAFLITLAAMMGRDAYARRRYLKVKAAALNF